MPELPEVEAGRRLAESVAVGHTITDAWVDDDEIVLQGESPQRFREALVGRAVLGCHRKGKHQWWSLDDRPWPCFHFGMTGRFVTYPAGSTDNLPRYPKIEITFDHGICLCMPNPRRLGRLRLRENPPEEPPIGDLGYDALLDLPTAPKLHAILTARKAPLKALLLDQRLFAGVGNWIADEALYQAGLSPHRRGHELTPEQTKALRAKLRHVVKTACDANADKTKFPRSWLFHQRWGKVADATIAGHAIVHDTIGGRTTAWVPARQA